VKKGLIVVMGLLVRRSVARKDCRFSIKLTGS
jgi:hypothetical protein